MGALFKRLSIDLPWNVVDKIVVDELVEIKKLLEKNLEDRYNDVGLAMFHVDRTQDIFEHKHTIQSVDQVLKCMYRAPHHHLPSLDQETIDDYQ